LFTDAGRADTFARHVLIGHGHNVASKAEVDAVMLNADAAGATIVKPADDTSGVVTQVISRPLMDTFGR